MIFGYARISSKSQNLSRQLQELKEYGCDRIYKEMQSGKNFERPVYREMRSKMRFGDVLVVHDLSRFGRNKQEIKDEWKVLVEEEIDIVVLNMPILDTRKYKELEGVGQLVSDLVLTLLSWMVEEERSRIRTAQREGIEIAKKQGKFRGGQKRYHKWAIGKDKVIYDEVVRCLDDNVSVMDIHRKTGLSRNTIYSIKKEIDKEIQTKSTTKAEVQL
ncbi:recombinase family protein [Virgibacillus ndiopensis]|uniref:recombinase family protein n=1 Tax=Virgibacillus ndiopensis TaxID=2004408 RepID=UPI000C07DF19|nr:recombinase family protein [Virgibacillus ndiopensis]